MAFGFLKKLSGDPSESELRKIKPLIERINSYSDDYKTLKKSDFPKKTAEFKDRFERGESLDELLPEAFALVREVADRTIGERHFDVQLMGGAVLHRGNISEMKTGEGKTLTATLPTYLNALSGRGVHVVTVNEYLAKRDTEWMGQIYTALGLTVGNIYHEQPVEEKRAAYQADITYGTNNEFGFDYLRDNMVQSLENVVQRDLAFAIVDEVDSILIDEARTPLIISAPDMESSQQYARFAKIVPQLHKDEHFTVDEKRRSAVLTDAGIAKVEQLLGITNVYEAGGVLLVHHLEQALQAHALYHLDKDYVVKDGQVIIVDEFTGRLMAGRRYSEGLHQAIEAKEGVEIQQESRTMATITFQNYFRLYEKLSGMTGTALTEKEEFQKIYSLDVVSVPTHREIVREDLNDVIYKTEQAKFEAVARDVKERHQAGQPVLLGTIAVEKSEVLSSHLKRAGIPHEVLNAKNHAREADIIAAAGTKGAVTVSTNMAGRGTDIKLGDGIAELGGLHVIGSERHESRRIDNQLRGRAGRQGDPGSTQFYVSLEDDLMRIFAGDRIKSIMERLKVPEDQPIEAGIISRSLESAQKKVEGHNFDIRKHVVEYDDVMNSHREVIYSRRRKLLEEENSKQTVLDMFTGEIDLLLAFHAAGDDATEWQYDQIAEGVRAMVVVEGNLEQQLRSTRNRDELRQGLLDMIDRAYTAKEEEQGEENMRKLERAVLLRTMDTLWVNHLDAMEHLREGIGLRGYGQRDPLVEYKQESYRLFEDLLGAIQTDVARSIFKMTLVVEQAPSEMEQAAKNVDSSKGERKAGKAKIGTPEPGEEPIGSVTVTSSSVRPPAPAAKVPKPRKATKKETEPQTVINQDKLATEPPVEEKKEGSTTITVSQRTKPAANPTPAAEHHKVGRNDPCPCGSGLKYKKCGLIGAPQHNR